MSSVVSHFDKFDGVQKKTLVATWKQLVKLLPGGEQTFSYGMPTIKVGGVALVSIDGFKNHNSLFPHSGSVLEQTPGLKSYVASKGTLQFPLDEVLALTVCKAVLKVKIRQVMETKPKTVAALQPILKSL